MTTSGIDDSTEPNPSSEENERPIDSSDDLDQALADENERDFAVPADSSSKFPTTHSRSRCHWFDPDFGKSILQVVVGPVIGALAAAVGYLLPERKRG